MLSVHFLGSFASAMPAQIILMRHAEKAGGSELSDIGWQRARALPTLFRQRTEFLRFGPPAALYAMNPSHDGGSVRAIQTLQFVAEDLKLPLRTNFTRDEYAALVAEIKADSRLDGKSVVVCWQHDNLLPMAQALGLAAPPAWPSTQFDRAWVLTFSSLGTLVQFENLPERLLPTDSAK